MTFIVMDRALSTVPSHWERVEIRRVTTIRRETNRDSSATLLSLSASDGVRPRPDDGGRQLPSADTVANYWLVRPSDLVFNPMWAIEGGVAVSEVEGAVSTAYRVYQFPAEQVQPRFAHYLLRSRPALDQYRAMVRGVTTFDRSVTREDFEAMPIGLPPMPEQRAIADFLDVETARIDALIEKKRKLVHLLELRFESWIRSILRSLDTPILPLKRKWQVIDCKHRTPEYIAEGYPVMSPGDATAGRANLSRCTRFVSEVDFLDLTEGGRRPERGDIIYSRNASIGIACYLDTDEPVAMGQDVCLIKSADQDQLFLSFASILSALINLRNKRWVRHSAA